MGISVGIIGASGYAGGEVARILSNHPEFEVNALTAASSAGMRFGDLNPHIPSLVDRIIEPTDVEKLREQDLVVVGLPHGQSAPITKQLEGGPVIIDAGADHRLLSKDDWDEYYSGDFAEPWTYGVPELIRVDEAAAILSGEQKRASMQRELLKNAKSVAAPGCNATAVTLALMPAVAAGFITSGHASAALTVGYSGAGRGMKPNLMAVPAHGNVVPYSALGQHRHIPEIIQNLKIVGVGDLTLDFTPTLVPISRGILAIVNTRVEVSDAEVKEVYNTVYANEPVIEVINHGFPQLAPIAGTGRVQVWAGVNPKTQMLTAIAGIDNLGKGTAAAVVQSANLVFGFDELTAIPMNGVL
ncbi:MAG: Asd/ArgC dimerization domain-containing protein [Actinomycetaceae bacterium]|nr:Asd/ArgC dimerization domain-containing protein [Actinomycetaceae bacterium]